LLLATVAAPAAAGQFELRLGQTPVGESLDLGLEEGLAFEAVGSASGDLVAPEGAAPSRVQLLDLHSRAHWSAMQAPEQGAEPSRAADFAQDDGGTWRWLKRHWWVPVLVAGAVVLAVQDDSPDSDD
jgi:hypothetical protein